MENSAGLNHHVYLIVTDYNGYIRYKCVGGPHTGTRSVTLLPSSPNECSPPPSPAALYFSHLSLLSRPQLSRCPALHPCAWHSGLQYRTPQPPPHACVLSASSLVPSRLVQAGLNHQGWCSLSKLMKATCPPPTRPSPRLPTIHTAITPPAHHPHGHHPACRGKLYQPPAMNTSRTLQEQ